jgi:lysophospholipase L1-like esterase
MGFHAGVIASATPPSTQTFNATDAHISWVGYYRQASGNRLLIDSELAYFAFTATGTDLTLAYDGLVPDANFDLEVDGVTTTPTLSDGSNKTLTLFSGLSDTAHTVKITRKTWFGAYFHVTNLLSLTGTAPALSYYTAHGPTYRVADVATYMAVDGTMATSQYTADSGGSNQVRATLPYGQIRFRASCTGIKIWAYSSTGIKFTYLKDGVDQLAGTPVVCGNDNVYKLITLASGLDSSTEHEYTVVAVGTAATLVYQVMTVGGTANQTTLAALPMWAYYGDSITIGYVDGGNTSPGLAWPFLIDQNQGVAGINLGIPSTSVWYNVSDPQGTTLRDNAGEHRTAQVTGLATAPARVVIAYGINDCQQSHGTESAATFQASYTNMLTLIRAGLPSARIDCLGTLNTTSSPASSNRAVFNAAISAAVSGMSDANIHFFNMDGVIDPVGAVDTVDGLHLTAIGNGKVRDAYLAQL